ncbi:MAG TPA: hypothetical protein VE734_12195 [Terriglobales bacterium]|nr:hypothetical protein [Terriglobales bacterium]
MLENNGIAPRGNNARDYGRYLAGRDFARDDWVHTIEASCMEPIVICIWCRQRVNRGELANGEHNHVDERERLQAQAETKVNS